MSIPEYKRMIRLIVGSVIASLILSSGSLVANHYQTKYRLKDNERKINNNENDIKRIIECEPDFASKDYVNKVYENTKEISLEREKNVDEKIKALERKQDKIYNLLWDINNKIK